MKNRGLLNPFSEKTKELFRQNLACWICNRNLNGGLSAHHVKKRTSSSALNLAPLCDKCHSLGNIHYRDTQIQLLGKTLKYLLDHKYKLKQKDLDFLEQNKDYYEEVWAIYPQGD